MTDIDNTELHGRAVAVDPDVLTKMVGNNVGIHKKLFDKFIEDTPRTIEQIEEAYLDKQASTIGALGHKLKSSSRALGANPFADLCFGLERAGKDEDWPTIEALYPQIMPLFEDVKGYVTEAF